MESVLASHAEAVGSILGVSKKFILLTSPLGLLQHAAYKLDSAKNASEQLIKPI